MVWIVNCDVTSFEIWCHYIYTIWRSKVHYFRQNNTTMKKYRWTTWNSNWLLQGRPRSSASLGLIIRFILTDWIKPFKSTLASLKLPFAFILAGIIVSLWRLICPPRLIASFHRMRIIPTNTWTILETLQRMNLCNDKKIAPKCLGNKPAL